ncbi:HEAT repeat domain-containing protein [Robiginitalea aurantiaca]|uniref:HEAT repeat domain-containing protein n=1 Tax=Robiginitalea aurantiaca TaxID=3056915 RepID=A0ABT7WFT0_9FLAO|nr:HEAT repeat domain-containing protein [Robiginitalea aurantiaca]MDM9631768.1 HEAT repeat domain-containing protein [Robiginitalea aurantiaca]
MSTRKAALEPVIRNYLLEQTESASENESDLLWMKMEIRQLLKNPVDRGVITEIILEVQREALPATRSRISELYQHFDLHDQPLRHLESRKWDKVSRAISELTEMQVSQAYDAIKEHINSKNSIVRKQAQLATIRLKEEGIKYFLDTARFPISQWQQVRIMEILTSKSAYTPPSFRNWLISENQDVVLFSLRLIRVFKQADAQQALLMFLHHKSERIQIAALECIGDFRYVPARNALIACFENATAEIKIHILSTLETIGNSRDIPWLQIQADSDESFLVRSKAGMVINTLQSADILPGIAAQGEFEFWTSQPSEEDPEIPAELPQDAFVESDDDLNLFSSEPQLINTLRPDFSASLLTIPSGDLQTERNSSSFEELLSETPDDIPLEMWTEEHESVFEDCIIEELLDILREDPVKASSSQPDDGFLPLIVDQIKKPYDMEPGTLTPEWIRELEVEIESLAGSTGYLGVLREILLEELRETEHVLETEFVPVLGGEEPPEFIESGDFDEALPLSDLLPEFIVEPEEIQEARNELDGGHELSHTDSEIGCFSIFEEFFRSYDTESKLILLDEIHIVGGPKELLFLKGLFTDPDRSIQKKAKRSFVLLKKRMKQDPKANLNPPGKVLWEPSSHTEAEVESGEVSEDSEDEYFSFSPDPDFSFPCEDEAEDTLYPESENGYYRLLNQIKGTKNKSDV